MYGVKLLFERSLGNYDCFECSTSSHEMEHEPQITFTGVLPFE